MTEATPPPGWTEKILREIPEHKRRDRLRQIKDETKLHSLIRAVLVGCGYDWARITHGPNEHGKDVVGEVKSVLGDPELHAFVVKCGKLSGGAKRGSPHKLSSTIQEVKDQVALAYEVPYTDENIKDRRVAKVVVVCNGNISGQAQTQISQQPNALGTVTFWNLDKLEQMVSKFEPGFFIDARPEVVGYLARLDEYCEDLGDAIRSAGGIPGKSLSDVFVEPRMLLVPSNLERATTGRKLKARKRGSLLPRLREYVHAGTDLLVDPPGSLFLIGDPGMGKTRALRRAAGRLIAKHVAGDVDAPFPLWSDAADLLRYSRAAKGEACALSDALPIKSKLPEQDVEHILTKRKSILYVDGLDQIPSGRDREELLNILQGIREKFPSCSVVCGTRPVRFWTVEQVPGFQEAYLLPMTNLAVNTLLANILGETTGVEGVLRGLAETGLGRSLPQTPLVVTLLAILYQQAQLGEVPANVSDLYRMASEVFLGRWAVEPGANGPYSYSVLRAVVSDFAERLHQSRRDEGTFGELREVCGDYMMSRGIQGDPREVAQRLAERCGVLTIRGDRQHEQPSLFDGDRLGITAGAQDDDVVRFYHLSFQEYFTAEHHFEKREIDERELFNRLEDPWWGTVCFFYAGLRKDIPRIIEHIVEQPLQQESAALLKSIQLGYILQAAHQTPHHYKSLGCRGGAELVLRFHDAWAEAQATGGTPVRFSRFELTLSVTFFYALAYGSRYLEPALRGTFDAFVKEYVDATAEHKQAVGVMAFACALALAEKGDFSRIDDFCSLVDSTDLPLLQTAAFILDEDAPRGSILVGESTEEVEEARSLAWKRNYATIRKKAKRWREAIAKNKFVPARPLGSKDHDGQVTALVAASPEQQFDAAVTRMPSLERTTGPAGRTSNLDRALWALELAHRADVGEVSAAVIATWCTSFGKNRVGAANMAKFFREARDSRRHQRLWAERRDGRHWYYTVTEEGRARFRSLFEADR